ncbi:ChaN family lipoprotein [Marinobacter sp. SS13-12]|uniref:ChaN family lipoprotein n=1 Tax=Marinobacter sp. SS13-12 TaxID=3050451 RepID=UPI002553E973|nr:ChaN family lipoprotein [Marinobacter sp. SS13-12]MDK8462944.1 ChaN family lipoprotein [Marinobacter sp. SS13-12]
MTTYSHTLVILACLLFAGCSSLPASNQKVMPPQTQYDSIIADDKGRLLSINQLAEKLTPADVVVIGEFHGHHGAHLLQSLVQSSLYQQRPRQVLSMEQFTLDDQSQLDRYLSGKSGEEELIADTGAWPNYKASYRPLIEFSKKRNIPVIAANAPADIVRCVGRTGEAYLDGLHASQRQRLPEAPFFDTPDYRRKFFDTLGGGHGETDNGKRLENSYKAQLLRDNTMADRVIRALEENPEHQVIHLTGTFHSEDRLGMVAVLEKKRPDLDVAVISPVFWHSGDDLDSLLNAHRGKGDFLYFLQPLPEEYKDNERRRDAIMEQFRNADDLSCD